MRLTGDKGERLTLKVRLPYVIVGFTKTLMKTEDKERENDKAF